MKDFELKYGLNPNQKPAKIYMKDGSDLPIEILNGRPGYINLLDAFNSYQLVRELKEATGMPAAASFKHVSPSGAAVGTPLSDVDRQIYFVDPELEVTPQAAAYIRARGAHRLCSFGDWVALSDTCDVATAKYLSIEVSDGIIAPAYEEEALEILKTKKKGNYCIIQMDETYVPEVQECRDIYGVTFEQGRNNFAIEKSQLDNVVTENTEIPETAKTDLLVALLTLKYTQSNSVVFVKDGQTIGVGAGQQSRVHCVRLAGEKADFWFLRQHPKVLNLPFIDNIHRANRDNAIDVYVSNDYMDVLADGIWEQYFKTKPEILTAEEKREWLDSMKGVALGSDAFFPFGDSLDRAAKSGVEYVAEPGGSIRDGEVIDTANRYGMAMAFTGMRLFHH